MDLRILFERFDQDESGALAPSEFVNGLASLGFHFSQKAAHQLFQRIDSRGDSNGAITYDELHAFAVQQQQQMANQGMAVDSLAVEVQQLMASLVQPDASATARAHSLSGSLCDSARSLAALSGYRRNAAWTHRSSNRSVPSSSNGEEDSCRWAVLRQSLVVFKALLGAGGGRASLLMGTSSSSRHRSTSLVGVGGSALGSLREAVQKELLSPDSDLHGAFLAALTGPASLALSPQQVAGSPVKGTQTDSHGGSLEALLLSPTCKFESSEAAASELHGCLPLHFDGTMSRAPSEVALDAMHLLAHVLVAALEPDASPDLAANAVHLLAQPIPPSPVATAAGGGVAPQFPLGGGHGAQRTGSLMPPSALVALTAYLDYPTPGRRVSLRPHSAVRLAACECLNLFAKVLHKHTTTAANGASLDASAIRVDTNKSSTSTLLSLLRREHVPALRSSLRSLLDPANGEPLALCHASMDLLVTLVELHPIVAACLLQPDWREVPQSSATTATGDAAASGGGGGAATAASTTGNGTKPQGQGRPQSSSMPTPMLTVLDLFDDPLFLLREKGLLQGDTLKGLNSLLEGYSPSSSQAQQKLEQAAARAPDLSARTAAAGKETAESSEGGAAATATNNNGNRTGKPTVLELCPDGLLEVVAEHYLNGASQVPMTKASSSFSLSSSRRDYRSTENTVSAALPGATKLMASLWRHRFQDSTLGCAAAALAERPSFWDRLLAPLLCDLDEAGCGVGKDGESVPFELMREHESLSLPDYEVALSEWLDQHRDNHDNGNQESSGMMSISSPGPATQHCLELQTRADLLGILCQERLYAAQAAKKKLPASTASAASSPSSSSSSRAASSESSLRHWLREAAHQKRWSAWQREHLRLDLNGDEVEMLEAAAKREGVQLTHFLVPQAQRTEGSHYLYSLPPLQASFVNPSNPTAHEWRLLLMAERCNYLWSRADAQRRLSAATNAFMELDLQLRRGSSSLSFSGRSSSSQRALSQRPTRTGSPSVRTPTRNNNRSPRGFPSPVAGGLHPPVHTSTPSSSVGTPQGSEFGTPTSATIGTPQGSDFGTPISATIGTPTTGGRDSPCLAGRESPLGGGGGGGGAASSGDRGNTPRSFQGDQTSWAMIEALSNRLETLPVVKAGNSAANLVVLQVASDHAASLNAMLFHQLFSFEESLAGNSGAGSGVGEAIGRERSRLRVKRGKCFEVLRRLRASSHRLGLQLHANAGGLGGASFGRPLLDPSLLAATTTMRSGQNHQQQQQQPHERLVVEVEVRLRLLSATLLLVHTLRTSVPPKPKLAAAPAALATASALVDVTKNAASPFRNLRSSGDEEDEDDNPECLAELRYASELAAGTIPWAGAARQALDGVSEAPPSMRGSVSPAFGGSGRSAAEQLLSVAQAVLTALLAGGVGGESAAAGWQQPQVLPSLLASLYAASDRAADAISRAHDLDYIALRVQDDRALRDRRLTTGGGGGARSNSKGGNGNAARAPIKGATSALPSMTASNQAMMPPPPPPPLRPVNRRTQAGDLECASSVDALLGFLLGAARSRHLAPLLVKSGLVGQLCRNSMLHALKVGQCI